MLRFTREAEYGLLAVAYIASRPEGSLAYRKEIAGHHNIPPEFLAKVLQKLSRRGLIRSYRGIHGGYLLAREPATISIADVVSAVDGPMSLVECARPDGSCPQMAICCFREVLWGLQEEMMDLLRKVTVKDLAGRTPSAHRDLIPLPPVAGPHREGSEKRA